VTHTRDFAAFTSAVAHRLEAGEREYGGASFARSPGELVGEILEELEDVAGWAFVAWCRVRALEARMPGPGSEPAALHPPGRAPRAIHESTPAEDGRRNGG